MNSTESGQLSAATVVEQRVEVSTARGPLRTLSMSESPVARTVGQRFDATWTRPDASAPTRFHTVSGAPLPLAPGPVWILLVPA